MQSSENMMVCKRKTSQISVLLKLQLCFLHIEYAVGPQGSASRILACPMWVSVWTYYSTKCRKHPHVCVKHLPNGLVEMA